MEPPQPATPTACNWHQHPSTSLRQMNPRPAPSTSPRQTQMFSPSVSFPDPFYVNIFCCIFNQNVGQPKLHYKLNRHFWTRLGTSPQQTLLWEPWQAADPHTHLPSRSAQRPRLRLGMTMGNGSSGHRDQTSALTSLRVPRAATHQTVSQVHKDSGTKGKALNN